MPCCLFSFLSGSSKWYRSRSVRFHSPFGYLAICMPERRFFIRCRHWPIHYRSRSTGLRGFCFLSLSIFLSFWWDYCRRSSLPCCALCTLSSRRNTRREPTRDFPGETMLRVGGGNENTTLRKEEKHVRDCSDAGRRGWEFRSIPAFGICRLRRGDWSWYCRG